jgi:hypothetical protein
MRRFLALAAALGVVACAPAAFQVHGTTLITSTARPATDAASIKVYLEKPASYEVLGAVSAKTDAGWSAQQRQDLVLAEMRKRAAAIGANGILIESAGSKSSIAGGSVIGGTVLLIPVDTAEVRGLAIYVTP